MTFYDDLIAYGGQTALVSPTCTMTYAELDSTAKVIVRSVPRRSLVFLIACNAADSIAAYVGCLQKRVVPVLVNPSMDAELYDRLFATYRPQYVIAPKSFWTCGERLWEGAEYLLTATDYCREAPKIDDSLALLLTTSGSTGSPKLVRQTYRNINANTASIVEYLGITADDRAITTLPMSYTYGLSILQSHLLAGAQIILTEHTVLEKSFWDLFREKGVTTFGAVPYTYQILERLHFLQMELPSLRYVTQAGGRLGEELHFRFASGLREKGRALIVMYGATEATARMSYVPADMAVEKAGSIGIAIPGGRFELIDVNSVPIDDPDVVGELVYYGDNVTPGYAEHREDLNKGNERQSRLETGDMAKRDADGYYYVVGRKKRFLKLYGNRVNLVEIEDLLSKAGYETACVGEDDHMRIYTTAEETSDVVAYIAEKTGVNRAAFMAIHIDKIPRNDAGKVLYSELK